MKPVRFMSGKPRVVPRIDAVRSSETRDVKRVDRSAPASPAVPLSGGRFRGDVVQPPKDDSGLKDFFISYTAADQAWAEWIAWQLEQAGYTVVIQAWHFKAGSNFALEMSKATEETMGTLLVLSSDFLASPFTKAEWAARFAQDPTGEGRRLVPIRVRDCRPEGLLGPIVYVDLVGLSEAPARMELIRQIKGDLRPTRAPPFPTSYDAPAEGSGPAFPGPS